MADAATAVRAPQAGDRIVNASGAWVGVVLSYYTVHGVIRWSHLPTGDHYEVWPDSYDPDGADTWRVRWSPETGHSPPAIAVGDEPPPLFDPQAIATKGRVKDAWAEMLRHPPERVVATTAQLDRLMALLALPEEARAFVLAALAPDAGADLFAVLADYLEENGRLGGDRYRRAALDRAALAVAVDGAVRQAVEAEREACALLAETYGTEGGISDPLGVAIADAIRARANP